MTLLDRFVGKSVFIRTVTNYYTGKCVAVSDDALVIVDAAWIADTGRFSAALETGEFSEVEPYPAGRELFVGGIIDVSEWTHPLPRDVK